MFREKLNWELKPGIDGEPGGFCVMNAEFAQAKANTRRDFYRNVYAELIPDLYRKTDNDSDCE